MKLYKGRKAHLHFFLDVQKVFDTVWHDGVWLKLWELGVRGRMWRDNH